MGNRKFNYQNIAKDVMYYNFEVDSRKYKIGNFATDVAMPFASTWSVFGEKSRSDLSAGNFLTTLIVVWVVHILNVLVVGYVDLLVPWVEQPLL